MLSLDANAFLLGGFQNVCSRPGVPLVKYTLIKIFFKLFLIFKNVALLFSCDFI